MKEMVLSIVKKILLLLTFGSYIACCVDTFVCYNPYSYSASVLSMVLFALFFSSYILLLWFLRKNAVVLWVSMVISVISAVLILFSYFLSGSLICISISVLFVYAPFHGLNYFSFVQRDFVFTWIIAIILLSMFIYKLVLLILLKKYNSRNVEMHEKK